MVYRIPDIDTGYINYVILKGDVRRFLPVGKFLFMPNDKNYSPRLIDNSVFWAYSFFENEDEAKRAKLRMLKEEMVELKNKYAQLEKLKDRIEYLYQEMGSREG